jgi:hypothetical protein
VRSTGAGVAIERARWNARNASRRGSVQPDGPSSGGMTSSGSAPATAARRSSGSVVSSSSRSVMATRAVCGSSVRGATGFDGGRPAAQVAYGRVAAPGVQPWVSGTK